MIKILLLSALLFLNCPRIVFAQTHFIHSHSGTSSTQLAVWAAKDLNLFTKYGLDVELGVYLRWGTWNAGLNWRKYTVFRFRWSSSSSCDPPWR